MSKSRCAAHGGVGAKLVTSWKRDVIETKCCGQIVLPGVLTRLFLARGINEVVRAAQREALLEAAEAFDGEGLWASVAETLRRRARAIRVKVACGCGRVQSARRTRRGR